MHRECIRIISQNPKYEKNNYYELYNPFHFACRRWILGTQSLYNCT